jgi:hypothetical protein
VKPLSVTHAIAAAVIALSTAGCSQGPHIDVTNRSDVELRDVVLSGSGFSERIVTLPAGGHHSLSPAVRGESSLSVAFDAAGAHHEAPQDTYFEGGEPYLVTVTIDQQLKVSVDAKLR